MYDILEMALRTKKTYKLAENGLLKCFLNLSNNPNSATSLSPRDFFDSLAVYYSVYLMLIYFSSMIIVR